MFGITVQVFNISAVSVPPFDFGELVVFFQVGQDERVPIDLIDGAFQC